MDAPDDLFETLWKNILENWDNDLAHAALLEHALRSEQLGELAGRYRALQNDPDKGERAKKKLDGVVITATQLMFATKAPAPVSTSRAITIFAFVMCVVMLGVLARAIVVGHR